MRGCWSVRDKGKRVTESCAGEREHSKSKVELLLTFPRKLQDKTACVSFFYRFWQGGSSCTRASSKVSSGDQSRVFSAATRLLEEQKVCIDAPLPLITRLERPSYRPAKWDKGNSKHSRLQQRHTRSQPHRSIVKRPDTLLCMLQQ